MSRGLKSRPATSGIPIVVNYPGSNSGIPADLVSLSCPPTPHAPWLTHLPNRDELIPAAAIQPGRRVYHQYQINLLLRGKAGSTNIQLVRCGRDLQKLIYALTICFYATCKSRLWV